MTLLNEVFSLPSAASPLVNTPHDSLITDDRVGVEVELEGITQSTRGLTREVDPRWKVVEDGSLRNYGREFVFKEPMFGTDVVETIDSLQDTFDNNDIEPLCSNRCSVHVHLDVRDLEYEQLLSLVVVYLLCEPYFFAVGGEERRHNMYSMPLATSEDYLTKLGDALRNPTIDNGGFVFRNHINRDVKYSAFNVAPVITQGSVEFRHHRGEWRLEPLLLWINMVLGVKRYVRSIGTQTMTPEYIDHLVNGGYDEFIGEVFKGIPIPTTVDGWGNAAKVAKKVSCRAQGIDDAPVFLVPEEVEERNLFIIANRNVGREKLRDYQLWSTRMYDRYGRDREIAPVGWTPLNRYLNMVIDGDEETLGGV